MNILRNFFLFLRLYPKIFFLIGFLHDALRYPELILSGNFSRGTRLGCSREEALRFCDGARETRDKQMHRVSSV